MNDNTWDLLQWLISIMLGLVAVIYRWINYRKIINNNKAQNKESDIDFINYVFYKPLALTALWYISTVVTQMKYINFSEQFYINPKSTELSHNLNKTYSELNNSNHAILRNILDEKVEQLNTFLIYATNNEKVLIIDKKSNEFSQSAYKIYLNAKLKSIIYATSYVNPNDWWYGLEGQSYLQKNYDFINTKKGEIHRIHIFKDDSDYLFFKKILAQEKLNGIKVYIIYTKDIPETQWDLKQDIIVVTDQIAGKLQLDDSRNALSVSYYGSPQIREKYEAMFQRLLKMSKSY